MGNVISSVIFSARSGDKALHGDSGRSVTCLAQGVNAAEAYSKAGFAGSKAAGEAVHYIDDLAKTESIWGKGAKGLQWVRSNINPFIGVCAAVKVATAKDKEKAFCTEVPGFMGMLAAESAFKTFQKTKTAKSLFSKIASKGGAKGKVAAAVVEGVGFAAASISGYMIASKIGECAIEGERYLAAKKALKYKA